jgi:hypothetical protein
MTFRALVVLGLLFGVAGITAAVALVIGAVATTLQSARSLSRIGSLTATSTASSAGPT